MSGAYGIGNYGYGNYSAPTDQPLTLITSAPEFNGRVTKLSSQTYMRAFSARDEFSGVVGALRSATVLRGSSSADEFSGVVGAFGVDVPLHTAPSVSEYSGWVVFLQPSWQSLMLVPGRFEYQAGARIGQWARATTMPARIEYAGAVGPLRAQTPIRPRPAANAFQGALETIRTQTVLRGTVARIEYTTALRVKATFEIPVRAAPFELAGTVRISYAWSDLTAPGRNPVPDWQDVPQNPADIWQLVPDLPPN